MSTTRLSVFNGVGIHFRSCEIIPTQISPKHLKEFEQIVLLIPLDTRVAILGFFRSC